VPIPDFQTIMLPLLQTAADGERHKLHAAISNLADRFKLTPEERNQLLPSGMQPVFDNRVGWARTYLKKAGLLETTAQGEFAITPRGAGLLSSGPDRITVKLLRQFDEFRSFIKPAESKPKPPPGSEDETQTPEETLEAIYQKLRSDLAQELLERVKKCPPAFFESLVVDLLVAMGYGGSRKDAGEAIGRSGDEGIDGTVKEDKLGLDTVCIQAKRWASPVGRPVVQAFAGSLMGHRANKGVLITTSQFTKDAREYIKQIEKRIVLIDGEQLAQYMIDHGIGVVDQQKYEVKKVNPGYFESE